MELLWVKFREGRRWGGGLPYKSDGMLFLSVEIAVFGLTYGVHKCCHTVLKHGFLKVSYKA